MIVKGQCQILLLIVNVKYHLTLKCKYEFGLHTSYRHCCSVLDNFLKEIANNTGIV